MEMYTHTLGELTVIFINVLFVSICTVGNKIQPPKTLNWLFGHRISSDELLDSHLRTNIVCTLNPENVT
jgi:hypothetical protein